MNPSLMCSRRARQRTLQRAAPRLPTRWWPGVVSAPGPHPAARMAAAITAAVRVLVINICASARAARSFAFRRFCSSPVLSNRGELFLDVALLGHLRRLEPRPAGNRAAPGRLRSPTRRRPLSLGRRLRRAPGQPDGGTTTGTRLAQARTDRRRRVRGPGSRLAQARMDQADEMPGPTARPGIAATAWRNPRPGPETGRS